MIRLRTTRHCKRVLRRRVVILPALLAGFTAASLGLSGPLLPAAAGAFLSVQSTTFGSWRPYSNPDRLVQIGMNKGQVIAIAGKPDYEESYYQSSPGHLIRISDWYFIRTGINAETTILKFVGEQLVSISSTLTR